MSREHFGTDGVRGVANEKLTPELALSIGSAAGRYLLDQGWTPRVVMGQDTRKSSAMLSAALASGFCSVGVDVVNLDVVPTGCVSFIARTGEYGMGAVISASHNPAPDNGIKLIAHDGRKLTDGAEVEIEALMKTSIEIRPTGAGVGLISRDQDEIHRYMEFLESIIPERLEGMRVAVDGAHGAAYVLGPEILRRLGAEVTLTGVSPDGMNINEEGGATKSQTVQELTRAVHADVGVAFDGDADRAVFSDSQGNLFNGDRTIAIWCSYWQKQGSLTPPAVVGTVMNNMGFERYLRTLGVDLHRVNVGDKYVSQKLDEIHGKVGGEQSGHIIFSERGVTGDGLITALELFRVLKISGKTAAEYFEDYTAWPQLLTNVNVRSREELERDTELSAMVSEIEAGLGLQGRINVRPSGTQPMVRVMVEAEDLSQRDAAARKIVEFLKTKFEGTIYSEVDLTYALGD